MMKKNRTIYFLLALVCLGLQSCLFQEEDYFDDSSANRATADVKRCSELLEAAPNGWVMEYYVGKRLLAGRYYPALQVRRPAGDDGFADSGSG